MLERELILPEHAELFRTNDGAALRLGLAGQQPHERGLAGAIWSRQTIPPSGRERRRDIVEEHFGAEPHGDLVN